MRTLMNLAVFVLVLAVFKFFFGWNISIIGSLVFALVFGLLSRLLVRN